MRNLKQCFANNRLLTPFLPYYLLRSMAILKENGERN